MVPFFNVERYIHECLESLRHQTLTDLEVILVDDGSRDGTRAIAERHCEADSRLRLVTQDNAGLGPARNAGLPHASGEFLTFVDSDDVLPVDAYERMVSTLQRTGSDFATGRAVRFNSLGVTPSGVQDLVCAVDRDRTHISVEPVLGIDRMAWNKVYRREFYESHDLLFPAMLLEDFPVSVRAHVDARAVDTVSTVMYCWRTRDGGEPSITQRSAEPGNIADRLRSAHMVLDVIEAEAPRSLPLVRKHLFDVDLDAMAAAYFVNDEEHRPALLVMAQELNERLGPDAGLMSSAFGRLQAELVARGDTERLVELRRWYEVFGKRTSLRSKGRLRQRWVEELPFIDDGVLPESVFLPDPNRELVSVRVDEVSWEDDVLHLELALETGFALEEPENVEVALVAPDGRRVVLPSRRVRRPHRFVGTDLSGVLVQVRVSQLADEDRRLPPRFWVFEVSIRDRRVKLTVPVLGFPHGAAKFAPTGHLPARRALQVQPYRRQNGYGIVLRRPRVLVDSAAVEDGGLALVGSFREAPTGEPVLQVRSRRGETRHYPVKLEETSPGGDAQVVGWRAWVPATDFAQLPEYDDPVPIQHNFATQMVVDKPMAAAEPGAPDQVPEKVERPICLGPAFESVTATVGSRGLSATRDVAGRLELVEARLGLELVEVTWVDDHRLRFRGRHADSEPPHEVLVEQFSQSTDKTSVHQLRIPLEWDADGFSFVLDVTDLVRVQDELGRRPLGSGVEPWHLMVQFRGRLTMLTHARDLLHRFAAQQVVGDHLVTLLYARNDVVRLRVLPC